MSNSSVAAQGNCPNCGSDRQDVFYRVEGVPVHSVMLHHNVDEALAFPKGDIELAVCPVCSFIWNRAFDPQLERYGAGYEATQAYSPTFNRFHTALAEKIVDRLGLRGKQVVEIGCGQGEFLSLLCKIGDNKGVGFDPAFDPKRAPEYDTSRISFVSDYYSEKSTVEGADFVCCKMTLEHIPNTHQFVSSVRQSIGANKTRVLFMIPNFDRIAEEKAFWDVYYEHCSYFQSTSLCRLFRSVGFEILECYTDYDDQYLIVDAVPSAQAKLEVDENQQIEVVDFEKVVSAWRSYLNQARSRERSVGLWGGGSKAVSFLTTLKCGDVISYAIDINPHKWGTFLPGSGHEVVGPDDFEARPVDEVIVMNPIYLDEIRGDLARRRLEPMLTPITALST